MIEYSQILSHMFYGGMGIMSLKKSVCILMIFVLILSFSACGKKNSESGNTTKEQESKAQLSEASTVVTNDEKVYEVRTEKGKDKTVTITVYPYDTKDNNKIRSLKYGLNTSKNDGTYFIEITDYQDGNFVMFRTNSVPEKDIKTIENGIYYQMLWAGLDGTVSEKDATEKVISVVGEGERESVFCEGFEVLDGELYYTFFIEKHDQTPAYYRVNVTTGEVTLKTASGVLI